MALERALLFIDGSNFYHGAKKIGVASGDLDYAGLASKLILDRQLAGVRYYVGKVSGKFARRASQERFLRKIRSQGVKVVEGRIERRMLQPDENPLSAELRRLVAAYRADLTAPLLNRLDELCAMPIPQYTEKRVDVSIAVDMVSMAYSGEYDVAFLLSADGDFVPAVQAVRNMDKKVFAASPAYGHELAQVVDSFITLRKDWFFSVSV